MIKVIVSIKNAIFFKKCGPICLWLYSKKRGTKFFIVDIVYKRVHASS